MKKGWQTKPIGEVATIKPPKSEARERVATEALVSFLPMEDLGIAIKYPQPKQAKKLSEVMGSYTYFAEDDVLLAKITPCFENGKLGIAKGLKNGIGFGSSEFIVLRPYSTITSEWLFYFLSREDFRSEGAQQMGGAVGQQRVPKEFIEVCQIPVPPLPEQHRIVGILDEAFDGLARATANAEQNLRNARALFESHLQSVFIQRGEGWVETTIGDQMTLQRGFDITKDHQRTGTVLVVSSGGIKSFHDSAKVNGPGVVIGRKGTLGKIFYLPGGFWPHDTTLWVKEFNNNHPHFVYYFFRSLDVVHLDTGTANPALNRNLLHPIRITWPPLSKQIQLAKTFDALEVETQRLESIYEQKLAALAELKKSLLHQAFNGELTKDNGQLSKDKG